MKRIVVWIALLIGVLTACGGGADTPQTDPNANPNTSQILVWTGQGPTPEDKTANTPGQLAYLNPTDGALTRLLEVPANAVGVMPCGPLSPDRQKFTFMVNTPVGSKDGGTLYQIVGNGTPSTVGEIHAATCLGSGTFQYTPDSQRFALIDYTDQISSSEYGVGTLRLYDSQTLQILTQFEDVSSFDLTLDGLSFVRFFANENGLINELALFHWTTGEQATELGTLFADEGCRFTSSDLLTIGDQYALMLGHRCAGSGTTWRFYTLNRTGGEPTLAMSGEQVGAYFPYTRTNHLISSGDSQQLFFLTADGFAANTVRVHVTPITAFTADSIVIEGGAQMPRYTTRAFTQPANAFPVISPDGRWWALTVATGRSEPILSVIDLTDPNAFPVEIGIESREQVISSLIFTPDSGVIYYVAGSQREVGNSLFRLTLASQENTRVVRGTFGPGIIAPDGSQLAFMIWNRGTDRRQTPYTDFALVNPADGTVTRTLSTGITYAEDGSVQSTQFVYPLWWR